MFKKVLRSYKDVTEFLGENKFELYSLIIDIIKECHANGEMVAQIAEFLLTDEDIVFKIEMKREDWSESIHLALYYFEEIEDYEKCSEIRDLISEIYGK